MLKITEKKDSLKLPIYFPFVTFCLLCVLRHGLTYFLYFILEIIKNSPNQGRLLAPIPKDPRIEKPNKKLNLALTLLVRNSNKTGKPKSTCRFYRQ